jgi:hypothetical protein
MYGTTSIKVNVQCSTNSSPCLRETKSRTRGLSKVAILRTQLKNSMKLLNEIFGECVIFRNLWPPRSPDLTPPDFYLWGAAKSAVYRDRSSMLNP